MSAVESAVARLRLSRKVNSPRWLRAIPPAVLYGLATWLATYVAFWALNTNWPGYDDEGFFVYSLKGVVAGHPIYSSVYSEYGPFYYLLFALLFKLTGVAVTLSAGRVITLTLWILSALGFGLTVHRFTRRYWLGLAVGLLVATAMFAALRNLTSGSMHPQVLVVALTVGIVAVILLGLPRYARAAPALLGALVAALALTKVNLGGYACIAIAVSYVMAGPLRLRRPVFLVLAAVVLLALPPVLMASELSLSWQRLYAADVTLSAAGLILVAWPRKVDEGDGLRSFEIVKWTVIGLLGMAVLVIVALLATGATPAAWIDQTIIEPLHQASLLQLSFFSGGNMIYYGPAGVVIAGTVVAIRQGWSRLPPAWVNRSRDVLPILTGVARFVIGMAMIMPYLGLPPFNYENPPYEFSWPLVWVVALVPYGQRRRNERLARVMLAALTISQSLMAYPVAGSQVALGGLLFIVCGGVCVSDGVEELIRLTRFGLTKVGAGLLTSVVLAIAYWGFNTQVGSQLSGLQAFYNSGETIHGFGAGAIRLPQPIVGDINNVLATFRAHDCRALMELPGEYSFNVWTGLPTPDWMNGEQPYWGTLSSSQQRAVLVDARATRGLCLLRSPGLATFYLGLRPLPQVSLVRFLEHDFRQVRKVDGWFLYVRKRRVAY